MKDFFDALSDFLSSDLARNNSSVIVVLALTLVVLTALVTCIIFDKIVIPLKIKKSEDIMPDYQKVLQENEKLKKELGELKSTKGMLNAVDSESTEPEALEGWQKEFLKQGKGHN